MKIAIALHLILIFSISCKQRDTSLGEDLSSDFTIRQNTKDEILREFDKTDKKYLNEQESCFFRLYVNDLMDSLDQDYSQVSNDIVYKSGFCPLSKFSFALLRNIHEEEYHYFGFADIYQTRFLQTDFYLNKDSIKIVEFETKSLNDVMLRLFSKQTLTKGEITKFLFSLYNDKINSINQPIFTALAEKDNLIKMGEWIINNSIYKDLLEWDDDQIVFFELETKGLIVFAFVDNHGVTSLREFYVPPIKEISYYKSDAIPSYYFKKCR